MTPDMVTETKWFKSPYVGVVSLRVLNSYFSLLSPCNFSSIEQGYADTGHDVAVKKKLLPRGYWWKILGYNEYVPSY